MVDLNYLAPAWECSHLLNVPTGKEVFYPVYHTVIMKDVREEIKKKKLAAANDELRNIESGIDKNGTRRLNYLKEKGIVTWLAATPSYICGTVLSALEFSNGLRDHYGMSILNVPSHCDGCTSEFSTTPDLSCKVDDLIHSRYDDSRDTLGCLACVGFQPSNVRDEPHINLCRDIGGKNDVNKLVEPQIGLECELEVNRDDLLIRGFWDRGTDCIIDVRICDVNQPSYFACNSVNILKSAENTKKKHYLEPCLT